MKIFYLYADSAARKKILDRNKCDRNTYLLYGQDYAARYGCSTLDDLDICERIENSFYGKIIDFVLNKIWGSLGALGGSWHKIFALRHRMREADLILSTADRVGVPLTLLKYFKLAPHKPIIYVSIGLFEKLKKLRPRWLAFYRKIFAQNIQKIICYGYEESLRLQKIFGQEKVKFIPFGVDTEYFRPPRTKEDNYLLSIGKDRERDFDLLINLANLIPEKILLITTLARMREIKKKWTVLPPNVSIILDVPFSKIRTFIARAKFIVLPVKENSYSGATTTLLQAMAMGKAVVVSKTGAIQEGYRLEHGKNCIFVKPGSGKELFQAVNNLLRDAPRRKVLGENARRTVQKYLSWKNYAQNLFSVITHH